MRGIVTETSGEFYLLYSMIIYQTKKAQQVNRSAYLLVCLISAFDVPQIAGFIHKIYTIN